MKRREKAEFSLFLPFRLWHVLNLAKTGNIFIYVEIVNKFHRKAFIWTTVLQFSDYWPKWLQQRKKTLSRSTAKQIHIVNGIKTYSPGIAKKIDEVLLEIKGKGKNAISEGKKE